MSTALHQEDPLPIMYLVGKENPRWTAAFLSITKHFHGGPLRTPSQKSLEDSWNLTTGEKFQERREQGIEQLVLKWWQTTFLLEAATKTEIIPSGSAHLPN